MVKKHEGFGLRDIKFGEPRILHETICSICGGKTEVPFKPTEGRTVYCRGCYTIKQRKFIEDNIEDNKDENEIIEATEEANLQIIYFKCVYELCDKLAKNIAKNPNFLDTIEWRQLENLLSVIFEEFGFSVKLTPESKDGGKDIILNCEYNGKKHQFYVEVKHWKSGKKVGNEYLENFVNIILRDGIDKGLFLSTSGYTKQVYEAFSIIKHKILEIGDKQRIYKFCQTYARGCTGLFTNRNNPVEILFEDLIPQTHK